MWQKPTPYRPLQSNLPISLSSTWRPSLLEKEAQTSPTALPQVGMMTQDLGIRVCLILLYAWILFWIPAPCQGSERAPLRQALIRPDALKEFPRQQQERYQHMEEAALLTTLDNLEERSNFPTILRGLNDVRHARAAEGTTAQQQGARIRRATNDNDVITTYNCQGRNSESRAIDLTLSEDCRRQQPLFRPPRNITVQILQLGNSLRKKAYSCKASVTAVVARCGFDDITYSGIKYPAIDNPVDISPAQCKEAAKHKKIKLRGRWMSIKLNAPMVASWYSHGGYHNKTGRCLTADFVSYGNMYYSSNQLIIMKVIIKEIRGSFNPKNGRIAFSNGLVASYKQGLLQDVEFGTMAWNSEDFNCSARVSQIYYGPAVLYSKGSSKMEGHTGDLLTVEKTHAGADQYAGLVLKGATRICGRQMWETHLDGLVVGLLDHLDSPLPAEYKPEETVASLFIQTQLSYIHMSRALAVDERFLKMHSMICGLERNLLHTKLQMVASGSSPYALLDLLGKGFLLSRAGSSVYITECTPVLAKLTEFKNCTYEIPVQISNITAFADPLTFILQDYPTKVPCSRVTPVQWKIREDLWICSYPELQICLAPNKLAPTSDDSQIDLKDFTQGLGAGIYSQEQRAAHETFLRTSNLREAVLNNIAAQAVLQGHGHQIGPIFSDVDLAAMTHSVGESLIPFYDLWEFGQYYLYGLGLVVFIGTIKAMINQISRTYQTVQRRGCGLHLLTSCFGSLWIATMFPIEMMKSGLHSVVDPADDDQPDIGSKPLPGSGRNSYHNRMCQPEGSLSNNSLTKAPSHVRFADLPEGPAVDKDPKIKMSFNAFVAMARRFSPGAPLQISSHAPGTPPPTYRHVVEVPETYQSYPSQPEVPTSRLSKSQQSELEEYWERLKRLEERLPKPEPPLDPPVDRPSITPRPSYCRCPHSGPGGCIGKPCPYRPLRKQVSNLREEAARDMQRPPSPAPIHEAINPMPLPRPMSTILDDHQPQPSLPDQGHLPTRAP